MTTTNETFTVKFHIDTECFDPENMPYGFKVLGDETIITVPNVSEVLIDWLRDDELAEHFGIESEGLIYINRGVL